MVVAAESLLSAMLRDRRALDFAASFFVLFFSRATAEQVAGVTSLASSMAVDLAEALRLGGVRGALRSGSVV